MKEKNSVYDWEVPEIDLNLRHYSGHPSDVIKKLKNNIEDYLQNPNVSSKTRSIYSAIYHALNYYKDVSYMPAAEYGTGDTFLNNSIRTFNADYAYLDKKYNSPDPTVPQVITMNGRIKSPYSFVEKVREKIGEYIVEGRDFRYFNESIRDLIGIRVTVNPPAEIQARGLQSESNFLYQVYYDLMSKHGITSQTRNNPDEEIFKFIPVNSRYDKDKAQKIRERVEKYGFSEELYKDGELLIHIPDSRPYFIENSEVDSVCKDYNKWPKKSGYQSIHTCVTPPYSEKVEQQLAPKYIIPTASSEYSFEYQFRTKKQDHFAEYGIASHKSTYKPQESYHRLLVPFYIAFDDPSDYEKDMHTHTSLPLYSEMPTEKNRNKLKLRNFGESYKKFFGHTFSSYFGIPFKIFRDVFTASERNDILSRKKEVIYDSEHDKYKAVAAGSQPLTLTEEDLETLNCILKINGNNIGLLEFLEKHGLSDSLIKISTTETSSDRPNFSIYSVIDVDSSKQRLDDFSLDDKSPIRTITTSLENPSEQVIESRDTILDTASVQENNQKGLDD